MRQITTIFNLSTFAYYLFKFHHDRSLLQWSQLSISIYAKHKCSTFYVRVKQTVKLNSRPAVKPARWQGHQSCHREWHPDQCGYEVRRHRPHDQHGFQTPLWTGHVPCIRRNECSAEATVPGHTSTPAKNTHHIHSLIIVARLGWPVQVQKTSFNL